MKHRPNEKCIEMKCQAKVDILFLKSVNNAWYYIEKKWTCCSG